MSFIREARIIDLVVAMGYDNESVDPSHVEVIMAKETTTDLPNSVNNDPEYIPFWLIALIGVVGIGIIFALYYFLGQRQ